MKNEPLVSIVIPFYNAADYLALCLESVVSQSYSNVDIILVDNCSTDDSAAIAKEFEDRFERFRILRTARNSGGPAHPRNVGIAAAKGEYIAFLDADDMWWQEKLVTQISCMIETGVNFICSRKRNVDAGGKAISRSFRLPSKDPVGSYGYKSLLWRNHIVTSSVVIRRDFLDDLRFDEDDLLASVEDFHLWIRLMRNKACQFKHLGDVLVDYRLVNTSLSFQKGYRLMIVKSMQACCNVMVSERSYDGFLIAVVSHALRYVRGRTNL